MKTATALVLIAATATLFPTLSAQATRTSAAFPSYKDLKYPPLRQVKIPDVPTYTLPNGIKLYLLENHELPLVSGFALVRTGSLFDPAGKTGLAEITGQVLRTGGTKSKTGDEIDIQVERIAAAVESNISQNSGRVSFNCLRENTDELLALFKDVLTTPEFRQDKIDLLKGQYRGAIARRNDDAAGIASREFSRIIYGPDSPYGSMVEYETLDRISRQDLVDFYHRYYFPANTIIAIEGDFVTADMKSKVEKLFADWTVKQPPVPPFPSVTAKPAPGVYLAARNDVTQTFFNIGQLGGILKDKDYPALEVMSDILGGGFSSRLFRKVRTAEGLAYNISAFWGAGYEHPGIFQMGGSTKSPSTVDAIKASEAELQRMRTEEVTDQELQTSKDTVLNSFVFNFDSPNKTLSRIVTYDYYGYPKDFIFQYQKAIASVTKADVLRVAKQHLDPQNMVVVAVGKPADFGKPLTEIGAIKNIDLTIPEPKKEAAAANASSIANGKQLLARAQQAVGGADKLAAVKDITEIASVQIQTGQGAMQAKQTNQALMSGAFRQTQELPFGKVIAFFDGAAGWLSTPQGVMPMPPAVAKQVQMETFRQLIPLLLSDRNSDRTVNAVAANAVEVSDKEGRSVRLELDPASGLPLKESYQSAGMSGPTVVVETYSAWKDMGGLKLPSSLLVEQGGKKFADITVQDWKLNSGLKLEELSKKP